MTDPTYFTVVADYKSVVADLASDVDADPTLGPVTGRVIFTPVLQNGDVILATDATPRPTGYVPAPIIGRIDTDGRLKLRVDPDGDRDDFSSAVNFPETGTAAKVYFAIDSQTFYRWDGTTYIQTYPYAPIRLLADTDLLELSGPLFYKVTFSDVVYNGTAGYIAPFTFQAPTSDTELNLIEVMRQPGQPASGITKIAPGAVRLEGSNLIFSFAGVDLDDPIPINEVDYEVLSTEITDSSIIGRTLLTADNAQQARETIWATSPNDVSDILAAEPTVAAAAAAAASTAVEGALDDVGIVYGGRTITDSSYSFAITDSVGRLSWLAADDNGGIPAHSLDVLTTTLAGNGAVIGSPLTESSLTIAVSDSAGRRSDLELGPDGKFSNQVINSVKPRLGLSNSIPELTAAGNVYLSNPATGERTLLGTITGASNPTILDATSVRVDTSSGPRWVSTTVSAHRPVFPLADIACWGDSLTYGTIINGATVTQASPSYPQTLATALGVNVYNGGVPGAGSTEIACRQGGIQPQLTLTGNQIPSGSTAAITATTVTGASGWLPGKFVHGTLAGTAGTLTLSLSGSTWTFTPDSAPAANVSVAAGTKFFGDEGVNLRDRINIIWAGTNNYTDPTTVLRDVEAMVNWLTPYAKRYLVIGLTRAGRSATDLIKYPLQAAYGDRFVDLRGYLMSSGLAAAGISATATDTADVAAGNVPTSLLSDGLHFTQTGYTVIGQYLASIITSKNWI